MQPTREPPASNVPLSLSFTSFPDLELQNDVDVSGLEMWMIFTSEDTPAEGEAMAEGPVAGVREKLTANMTEGEGTEAGQEGEKPLGTQQTSEEPAAPDSAMGEPGDMQQPMPAELPEEQGPTTAAGESEVEQEGQAVGIPRKFERLQIILSRPLRCV